MGVVTGGLRDGERMGELRGFRSGGGGGRGVDLGGEEK